MVSLDTLMYLPSYISIIIFVFIFCIYLLKLSDLKGEQTCINKINPSLLNRTDCRPLEVLIPCLEFTIEIESNSLMYNPNKAIRDRVFPVKIGKFSVKYYTFEELQ